MKKRILSILLALALLCAVLPAAAYRASAATTSGSCGDNLNWTFENATGTLTITGRGKMDSGSPWESLKSSIKKVVIGNGVTNIGRSAFYECSALTSVTIPDSVTSIDYCAFDCCYSLKSVTIPNSVTSIGIAGFDCCVSLTSLTIPNSVTSIGAWAFEGCESLTSLTIPDSVTVIDNGTFHYCASLTSVTIPSGVTSIGEVAFDECYSLTSVVIPASVTSIGGGAFCSNDDLVIYGVAGSTAETYANENNIPFIALNAPKITTQPKSATVAVGKSATFTVAAAGGMLSYQWQYKRSGATAWSNWSGKTDTILNVGII